jgi:lysophospholipase L1-like esterase
MLQSALEGLKASGYSATHFLWHQGESDAHVTQAADYVASLNRLIAATRRHFPDSSFYVSAATYCEARGGGDEALRAAQRSVVDPAKRIHAGPDTDRYIALEDRMDGCHFSGTGQRKVAREWAGVLK